MITFTRRTTAVVVLAAAVFAGLLALVATGAVPVAAAPSGAEAGCGVGPHR